MPVGVGEEYSSRQKGGSLKHVNTTTTYTYFHSLRIAITQFFAVV
jgi:hypothetical protein